MLFQETLSTVPNEKGNKSFAISEMKIFKVKKKNFFTSIRCFVRKVNTSPWHSISRNISSNTNKVQARNKVQK